MFGNVKIRLETLMRKAFDGNRKTALREEPIARNDPDKPREAEQEPEGKIDQSRGPTTEAWP
jgi:hypothetical protein